MWRDVSDFREFYATSLGQVARRMICRQLHEAWPNVEGRAILGLGYAVPFLNGFRGEAARVVAAMPAEQGIMHWPTEEPSLTVLVDEDELPFPDFSFDRVVLVHNLEYAEQVRPLMREVWRVLADSGRLVVVVPNQRGLWARFDWTPFGHGLPYSSSQLSRLLRETLFTPLAIRRAVFMPPLKSNTTLAAASAWENIGRRYFPGFGGVIMSEAVKQIYSGSLVGNRPKRRRYVTVTNSHTRHQSRKQAEPSAAPKGP